MTRELFILARDENIFHPHLFDLILSNRPAHYAVTGAALVKSRETLLDSIRYVARVGGPGSLVRLVQRQGLEYLRLRLQGSPRLTVRRVLAHHRVPLEEIPTPNQAAFVESLQRRAPDIIFCAVPNILKEPILNAPTLACVNRHAGRLPDYRGLEPVFQALRSGESRVTVTYHTMVREIDGGTVLWEHDEAVRPGDTVYGLYDRLFRAAAYGFWQALDNLENGRGRPVDLGEGAYFSTPTAGQIAQFRQQGWRYV